jgi:hypothetical protein
VNGRWEVKCGEDGFWDDGRKEIQKRKIRRQRGGDWQSAWLAGNGSDKEEGGGQPQEEAVTLAL